MPPGQSSDTVDTKLRCCATIEPRVRAGVPLRSNKLKGFTFGGALIPSGNSHQLKESERVLVRGDRKQNAST